MLQVVHDVHVTSLMPLQVQCSCGLTVIAEAQWMLQSQGNKRRSGFGREEPMESDSQRYTPTA
jgi:hypothetical protein